VGLFHVPFSPIVKMKKVAALFFIFIKAIKSGLLCLSRKQKRFRKYGTFFHSSAGSNLPCSNQITNENPEELKDAEIQRFLADLRAISHFCKVFRVGQK
jgi:hypothetical protein